MKSIDYLSEKFEDGGRFEEILEVYDNEHFYKWLMEYEFIGIHMKDNNYLVIPVEYIFTSYYIH